MSKQIIVFIDGTGNNGWIDGPERTNVFKLYQRVKESTPLARYIRGIGSDPVPMGDMNAAFQVRLRNKYDQGLGIGATNRLKRAYRFIARHYETGDQIFLFGFSRGAFLAQILAGFLQRVGLLFRHPPSGYTVEQSFWLYWADRDGKLFADFLREVMPAASGVDGIRTHFLGQWDAVESMDIAGISAASESLLREIAARDRTKPLPHWIGHARHAVALHEVRELFEPLLWSGVSQNSQTLEQVWFAGAHADVGGGYSPEDGAGTRYSDISLHWMWLQATAAGLSLNTLPPCGEQHPMDVPHTPPLALFGGRPGRVRPALTELATAPRAGEYLHDSVLKRMWHPIDDAYARAKNGMRVAWQDADKAALRFHYQLRFSAPEPFELTTAEVQRAVHALEEFFQGKCTMSNSTLVQYASLALAFKAPLLSQYVDRNAFATAPAHQIIAAATALRAHFVEPEASTLRQDWNNQRRALLHLALQLKLQPKGIATPKTSGKI